MADGGLRIQVKVNKGYAKAASHLGLQYDFFRPSGPNNPLDQANRVTAVDVAFDASTFTFSKPNMYAKNVWYFMADVSLIEPGDYLVGPGGTFFVAAKQALLPPAAVQCNHTVNLNRPANLTQVGALGYNAGTVADGPAVAVGWPASVLTKSSGATGDTRLPRDTRLPWLEILLPPIPGVYIQYNDVLTDENGRRYEVSAAELSPLGWRIEAVLLAT